MFKLSDLLALYRQKAVEGLDLPGGARNDITDDPTVLRSEQQQADIINTGVDPNAPPPALDLPERDPDDIDLTQDDGGAKKTSAQEREDFLEMMANKRNKKRVEPEITDDVDDDNVDDDDDSNVNSGKENVNEPPVTTTTDTQEGFYSAQDGTIRFRTVVDGQVVDITAAEYQQHVAHLSQGQPQQTQHAPTPQQQAPVLQQTNAEAVNTELARLRQDRRTALLEMYNGDETAIDRLDEIDEQIRVTSMKSLDVVGQMTAHTQQQNVARWQSQISADEQELKADPRYSAVTKNPAAWGLAVQEAGRIMKETGADRSGARPLSVMQQAADIVLKAIGATPAATAPAPQVDARQQRKQQIGNTAVTAGAAPQVRTRTAQPAPAPDGGMTPQQARAAALKELRATKREVD